MNRFTLITFIILFFIVISKNVYSQDSEKIPYQLFYKTPDKIDSIAGNDFQKASQNNSFYFGTCSSNSVCLPQKVSRGIIKTKVNSKFYSKYFTLEKNNLLYIKELESSSFDLTNEENNFLENNEIQDWTFTNIELNKEYEFNGLKIIFTKLPPNSGNIKIQEITLNQEQIKQSGSLSNKAYEIISDMTDGTFTYNLSLPIPESIDKNLVEVKFVEEISQINSAQVVEDTNNINHFTIFIISLIKLKPQIFINEFVYNPSIGSEWVELYNAENKSIDLSNYRIYDSDVNYINLSGTISPHGFATFNTNWLDNTNKNLNGDIVVLKEKGSLKIVDSLTYYRCDDFWCALNEQISTNNKMKGQSIGRVTDGGPEWQAFSNPTKNYSNIPDITPPTAFITYNISDLTNQSVIATLNPSENIIVTNNVGSTSYIFSENGFFTFNFKDLGNNFGSATAIVSNIDKTPPVSAINTPTNTSYFNNEINIIGVTQDFNGVSSVDILFAQFINNQCGDFSLLKSISADHSSSFSWTYNWVPVSEGNYCLKTVGKDIANNTEDSNIITNIIFDKTISDVSISITPTFNDGQNGWYQIQPEVTLSIPNLVDTIEYQWDSVFNSWLKYSSPFKIIGEGDHNLYYRVKDLAGNISPVFSKNIKWDKTNPESGPQNISANPNPTSGNFSKIKWEPAKDNIDIDKYEIQWILNDFKNPLHYSKTIDARTFETEINNLIPGRWTVKVIAFDFSGNSKDNAIDLYINPPLTPTPSPILIKNKNILGATNTVLNIQNTPAKKTFDFKKLFLLSSIAPLYFIGYNFFNGRHK